MSNNSEPNNFGDKLQPDPVLRTGRANTVWVWIVIGAIAVILSVTAVGLFGGNHTLQNAKNSIIGDPPLPDGMSKRGQGAVLNDRAPSEASPKDQGNSPTGDRESWPRKSGQEDKWSFCLTAAKMAVLVTRSYISRHKETRVEGITTANLAIPIRRVPASNGDFEK